MTQGIQRTCPREGCDRAIIGEQHTSCSFMCHVLGVELERARRVCEATGDTKLWIGAIALNEALSEYLIEDNRVYQAAKDVGLTPKQWGAIKSGRPSGNSVDVAQH